MRGTIASAIARHAASRGGTAALLSASAGEITFAQLHAFTRRVAAELAAAGISRDDRVALPVPPGIEGAQLVVALASSATLVPLNPVLTAAERAEACRVSRATALVAPAAAASDALHITLLGPVSRRTTLRPRPADAALLLRSSGTTGTPKLIPVTHRNLVAMAERLGSPQWFGLTPDDRAVCTLPLYYAAGLKTSLFVPLILGQTVGFPPAGQAYDLSLWLEVLRPTYLSVAPTSLNAIVERLVACRRSFHGSSLRFVMCGAAHLPEKVRLHAESLLGVPVLEYYALSEAGAMAANPAPPGRIKPGTVGLPARGDLILVDSQRRRVPAGTPGEILIRGPTVMPGYVTAQGTMRRSSWQWLATGDLGQLDADGYLTIVGRTKELINRGGEKVFPYEIERTVLEHASVKEAAAFGVPHPRLGESVALAVVLKAGCRATEDELKRFLAARLAPFKLPRRIELVAELPRGETGKVSRASLSRAYAAPRASVVPPNDLLEIELRELWTRFLQAGDIGIDDDFLELGGDSLLATQMLLAAEELVGRPFPQSELATLTIRRMAQVFTRSFAEDRERITQVRRGAGIPLFFCHGDYLTRGIYAHRLAALLPGDQPVYLLHCPTDPPSIEDIARGYLVDVLGTASGGPVFVAGYCNGGLAAWHLAHLLRAQGVEVGELMLIDTLSLNARRSLRALARTLPPGPLREHGMVAAWLNRRGFVGGKELMRRAARKVLTRLGAQRPADAHVPRTADDIYLRRMAAYIPPRNDVPVTCFIAAEGRYVDTDPRFWRPFASRVQEVEIPGSHLTAPVTERAALAAAMAEVLRRAYPPCGLRAASARYSALVVERNAST